MPPLLDLYLFRPFQNRDEYREIMGEEPPEWDPNKPPKWWFDPEAKTINRRTLAYDVLVQNKQGVVKADVFGSPTSERIYLLCEDAATVNIPPDNWISCIADMIHKPIPVPIRPLADYERLMFELGGRVVIRSDRDDEADENRSLWEILIPVNSHTGDQPFADTWHRLWSATIKTRHPHTFLIEGPRVNWSHHDVRDQMIPIKIFADSFEIHSIINYTVAHYKKKSIIAYKVSDEVVIKYA